MKQMSVIRSGMLGLATLLVFTPVALHAQKQVVTVRRESPKGWVGLLITTGIGETNAAGKMVFNDYPVIESIDPGSPAEKAGLQAGDILVSINSQDFKKNPIPMDSLLQPGKKIVFRYRRDNVAKMSRLVVAECPLAKCGRTTYTVIGPDISRMQRIQTEGMLRRAASGGRVLIPAPVRVPPLDVFGTGTPSIAVAGAELTQLNEGLRELANVKGDGIFVVNVTTPSIAGDAGLRSGDIIVRVEKQLVQNPGQLIRFMLEAADNSLLIQILRKQKEQNLTLRW
jgi:S1-C subfamily serine protease